VGAGWDGSIAVSTKSKSKIFFERGLDATGKSVPQSHRAGKAHPTNYKLRRPGEPPGPIRRGVA